MLSDDIEVLQPGAPPVNRCLTQYFKREYHQAIFFENFLNFFEKFSKNLAGGRCPPDPPVFGWGGFAPPDIPPERSSAAFDRGGQTGPPRSNDFFFGAADDTRAARTSGRTTVRRPSVGRLTTGRRPSGGRPPTRSTQGKNAQGVTFLSA